jgi:AcrR family transcriptional regulator
MPDARERILAAAEAVIREYGLLNTTTKLIAKAAGCSEALLYKHYKDKNEIVLAVMAGRASGFSTQTADLRTQIGQGDIEERLTNLIASAVGFYRQGMPIGTALLSDPALLARHRSLLAERRAGPRKPLMGLAGYLAAEQALGRVGPDADPETMAALLLGSAFQRAFFEALMGDSPDDATPEESFRANEDFARRAVRAVLKSDSGLR